MGRLGWSLDRPDPIQIDTPTDVAKLKEKLSWCDLVAIDTETTGLDISRATAVYWSLSTGDDRYFLERRHLEDFKPVFDDPSLAWIGSQIKYDANVMANSGYPLAGDLLCTLTMDRLLEPGRPHDLKASYARQFGERMASFGETFYPRDSNGKPRKPPKKEMYEILTEAFSANPNTVIDYASMDAWAAFRLYEELESQLHDITTWQGHSLWQIFLWCEVPFTRVLYNMERNGTLLDEGYLKDMVPKIEKELDIIERQLNKVAGHPVKITSNPQLQQLFFKKMKLKPIKYTSGGRGGERNPSVDVSVLKHYAGEGIEEAKLVLKHRELKKLLGTYVNGLLKRVDPHGRIHTMFTQHAVDTSRLSSRDPNLQNQPRPRKDFDIRTAFIAPPGKKLLVADYDQLEMFLLAHFSRDQGMIQNILDGRDIHTANVELVWGEPYDEVAKAKKDKNWQDERADYLRELRNFVKVIGFGQRKSGRSKTRSKRGNPSGAIPCCAARRSVSTCESPSWAHSTRDRCSSDRLVTPPPSLTRRALASNLESCNGKAITTRQVRRTTTGEAACLRRTTRRSPTPTTVVYVSDAESPRSSSTTRMRIEGTTRSTTSSRCANAAIRCSSTTAPRTCPRRSSSNRRHVPSADARSNLPAPAAHAVIAASRRRISGSGSRRDVAGKRRDSQCPQQCGINTMNYGKAANSIARELGFVDEFRDEHPDWNEWKVKGAAKQKAQDLIDRYFAGIPGAADFIFGTYRKVADTKYVESYLGRRRWLPDVMDWEDQEYHRWEARKEGRDLCWCSECKTSRDADRQSVNTIIQGSAADVIMMAMIRCNNDPRLKDMGVKMLLQVHDELMFEIPEEHIEDAAPIIQYHMEHPGLDLRVPLKAEPGIGDNWVEAK